MSSRASAVNHVKRPADQEEGSVGGQLQDILRAAGAKYAMPLRTSSHTWLGARTWGWQRPRRGRTTLCSEWRASRRKLRRRMEIVLSRAAPIIWDGVGVAAGGRSEGQLYLAATGRLPCTVGNVQGERDHELRMQAPQEFPIGTKLSRSFVGADGVSLPVVGRVYDIQATYWRVRCPGGDWEELRRRGMTRDIEECWST